MSTQRGVVAAVRSRRWIALGLALVVVAGAGLRLTGSNWDGTAHVHPDERYVSSLANVISAPHGFWNYFDVHSSPLSPYLREEGRSYVYGTLPLFGTKLVAAAIGRGDYGALNVVGRRIGAVLDATTIVFVFVIVLLLLEPVREPLRARCALLAAALYAFTVTAIQHGHYFTVDIWLVFFGTATILLAMLLARPGSASGDGRRWPLVVLLGIAFGLTLACKVSGALVVVPGESRSSAAGSSSRVAAVSAAARSRWSPRSESPHSRPTSASGPCRRTHSQARTGST